jgi:hypothetical protein
MDNPNEYYYEAYAVASTDLHTAVEALWEAGATIDNIQDDLESAVENATGTRVPVRIEA